MKNEIEYFGLCYRQVTFALLSLRKLNTCRGRNFLIENESIATSLNKELGYNVSEYMKTGIGVLKNPKNMTWHHDYYNPVLQLIYKTEHTAPQFQFHLHPGSNGGGGYQNFYQH